MEIVVYLSEKDKIHSQRKFLWYPPWAYHLNMCMFVCLFKYLYVWWLLLTSPFIVREIFGFSGWHFSHVMISTLSFNQHCQVCCWMEQTPINCWMSIIELKKFWINYYLKSLFDKLFTIFPPILFDEIKLC